MYFRNSRGTSNSNQDKPRYSLLLFTLMVSARLDTQVYNSTQECEYYPITQNKIKRQGKRENQQSITRFVELKLLRQRQGLDFKRLENILSVFCDELDLQKIQHLFTSSDVYFNIQSLEYCRKSHILIKSISDIIYIFHSITSITMQSRVKTKNSEEVSEEKSQSKQKGKNNNYIIQYIVSLSGIQTQKIYIKHQLLGRGGFANCYITQPMGTNDLMATKVINKSNLKSNRSRLRLINQIKIHKTFSHPNIVQYLHHFEDYENVYIMLQLCQNESLNELLKERKTLIYPEIQSFLYGICNGVKYLHDKKYIHRDLKLGNVFLNDKFQIKIGDFGLTSQLQFLKENKRTVCGTPNYIAPQVLEGIGYYFQVDVWAIGIIIYTLFYGYPPFQSEHTPEIYTRIRKCQFSFPKNKSVPIEAINLIRQILVPQPQRRPTIEQILNSPFMKLGIGIPLQLPEICYSRPPTKSQLEAVPLLSMKQCILKQTRLSRNCSQAFVNQIEQKQQKHDKSTIDKTVSRQCNLMLTGVDVEERQKQKVSHSLAKSHYGNNMEQSNFFGHKKTMSSKQNMPTMNIRSQKIEPTKCEDFFQHIIDFEQIDEKTFYFSTSKYCLGTYERDRQICFRHLIDFQKNTSEINQVKLYNNLFSELGTIPINNFKYKALLGLKAKEILKNIKRDTLTQSLVPFNKQIGVKNPDKLVYITRVSQHKETTMVKLSNKCIQVIYYPDKHGFFYNIPSQKLFYYDSPNDSGPMKQLLLSSIAETVNKFMKSSQKSTKIPNIQTFVSIVDSNDYVKLPISNLKHIYGIISELDVKKAKHIRNRNSQ